MTMEDRLMFLTGGVRLATSSSGARQLTSDGGCRSKTTYPSDQQVERKGHRTRNRIIVACRDEALRLGHPGGLAGPLGTLDAASRHRAHWQDRAGITATMATHDPELASAAARHGLRVIG